MDCKELAQCFSNYLYHSGLGDNFISSPEKAIGKMLSKRNPGCVTRLKSCDPTRKQGQKYTTMYLVPDVFVALCESKATATARTRKKKG